MQETTVIIVGAGAAGLSTSACLNLLSIPNVVLEREDCSASLWKKNTYDRLHLHLPKHFCELPHLPFPNSYPKYVPKSQFVAYLDDYESKFKVSPMYRRSVVSAEFKDSKWVVKVENLGSGKAEEYSGRFLVVATGENADPFVPEVRGLETFKGEVIHSTRYRSGKEFKDKSVLVVGCGNSGMEIALDLSNYGARTSVLVRSPVHVVSKWIMHLGMVLMSYKIPVEMVDSVVGILGDMVYGDMSKYGIKRPTEGVYAMKGKYGKYPIFDVGTCNKIKSGEIQVVPAMTSISSNEVLFENGKSHPFDVIIFATGFKRSTVTWLKDKGDPHLLGEDGISKMSFPNNWKGKNGLYCTGLSRKGLYGINEDAKSIADDIKSILCNVS